MIASRAATTVSFKTATCRPSEWVTIGYFVYTATLASSRGLPPSRLVWALACPIILLVLFALETRYPQPWTGFLRHWLPLTMILAGYYQTELFVAPPLVGLQQLFISWDQAILTDYGLQAAVESLGSAIPTLLEVVYLSLYALPVLALAVIYQSGRSGSAERFLRVFYLGTFLVYALLPHFPTLAPRVAYPEVAPPHFTNIWRTINLYNLGNLDISTSVFPSGHVAVAFSAAFGLLEVISGRKRLISGFFGIAVIVYLATVYCRYHYAADGAASFLVCLAAWWISRLNWRPRVEDYR